MKSLSIFVFFLISIISLGQKPKLTDEQLNHSGANKLIFIETINQADSLAQIDINKNTPFLLLQSGIAPIVYTNDSLFEIKYHLNYFEFGCKGAKETIASEYNYAIFKYLTETFGNNWMKEIRKDVIGFKKYDRK